MNKVILCGNLGEDAELKYTKGGQAVARIRLCTNKKWTDKDGQKQERTEWHSCNWWGKGAEAVAKFMLKGHKVLITGELQTRSWDDKEGNKRYSTEVNVHEVELLTPKPKDGNARQPQQQNRNERSFGGPRNQPKQDEYQETYDSSDDDLPF